MYIHVSKYMHKLYVRWRLLNLGERYVQLSKCVHKYMHTSQYVHKQCGVGNAKGGRWMSLYSHKSAWLPPP